jgi:hypothetical protein
MIGRCTAFPSRDLPTLLTWARSEPHRLWWRRGGMETVYDDTPQRRDCASFAPVRPARGAMFGSAARAGRPEDDLYRPGCPEAWCGTSAAGRQDL